MKKISKSFSKSNGQTVRTITWELEFGIPPSLKPKVRRALKEFMSVYYDNMKELVDGENKKYTAWINERGLSNHVLDKTVNEIVSVSGENYFPTKKEFLDKDEKAIGFFNALVIGFAAAAPMGKPMSFPQLAEGLLPAGDFSSDLKSLINKTGLDSIVELIDARKVNKRSVPPPQP